MYKVYFQILTMYKLKALEKYFCFCHVNCINGLKGPDSVGRTHGCTRSPEIPGGPCPLSKKEVQARRASGRGDV